MKKIFYLISTIFGIGFFPIFPGTIASIIGSFFCLLIMYFVSLKNMLFIIMLFFILGIFICHYASQYIKKHDHKSIVLDEIIGVFIVITLLPKQNLKFFILGIILFRLFDIIKPWPIHYIDNNIKGGIGIMIDDIIAGIFSILVLYLLNFIF